MLCHQPIPYGMDMIPIAKVQNLSYNTLSAGFILVKFKNSPPNHQFSEQSKSAQNGVLIENFGNFSLKILGIFVTLPTNSTIYVLSKTYRGGYCTEIEVIRSSACRRAEVLWKDYHVYAVSEKFRQTEHETGYFYGTNEPEGCSQRRKAKAY